MSNPSVCSILDMPDEILIKIILHFDARERLALANSCQRFNNLVFGDEELLRNLDFTGEHQRTRASDIQQYFNDENTYKKILGINGEKVWAVNGLSSSIGRAIHLVQLNILNGLEFESVEELSRFLKPLVHLKRLSVNWPDSSVKTNYDNPNCEQVLEESLTRLTYLSLEIECYSVDFLRILQLCQQLKELRMSIRAHEFCNESPMRQELMKLGDLKFVRLRVTGHLELLMNDLMSIVPDPAEWTNFYLVDLYSEAYLEKNVEICEELGQVKEMPLPRYIADFRDTSLIDEGWPLVPEHLLGEVIRMHHEDVPKKFCCFSSSQDSDSAPCLLKIDEAKKLLKDPGYQISYLRFSHPIHENCDAHLLASAFPDLTTLVLSRMSNRNSVLVPEKTKPLRRRLRRKGSLAPEEDDDARNLDSSFKMLVENTPRLKVLEISPGHRENKPKFWDLDAFNFISGWKNLTVIRLYYVPMTDGKFLIDIGRECKKLEEVELRHLRLDNVYSYESELLQMLQHCNNLRKLSIKSMGLEHLSEMFNILSNCSRLAALSFETSTKECDSPELTSSVEKMLRQCQELKRFSIVPYFHEFSHGLQRDVERTISKLDRSDFQLHITEPI